MLRHAVWLDRDVTTEANSVAGEAVEDFCEKGVLNLRTTYGNSIHPSPNRRTERLPEYVIRTTQVRGNGTRLQVVIFFDEQRDPPR